MKNELLISKIGSSNHKIMLPTSTGYYICQLDEVAYFKADNNTCILLDDKGSKYHITTTLGEIESLLTDSIFFRIHKSYLINIDKIKTIHKNSGITLTMCEGSQLPVSRKQKEAFMTVIKKEFGADKGINE